MKTKTELKHTPTPDHRIVHIDELEIKIPSKLNEDFQYECEICGGVFANQWNVLAHCKREADKEWKKREAIAKQAEGK